MAVPVLPESGFPPLTFLIPMELEEQLGSPLGSFLYWPLASLLGL